MGNTIIIQTFFFRMPCTAKKARTVSHITVTISSMMEKLTLFTPKKAPQVMLRSRICLAEKIFQSILELLASLIVFIRGRAFKLPDQIFLLAGEVLRYFDDDPDILIAASSAV